MKRMLKWIVFAVVVLYAAWIAWPVVKVWLTPSDAGNVPMMAQDQTDYVGANAPMDGDSGAPVMESIQGDTAVDAVATHNTPVVALWGAVVVLYLLAAFLHANGNLQATGAYVLGFIADVALTYITNGNSGGGIWDKLLSILSGWDPRYVLTLVALVLGFLIYAMQSKKKLPKLPDLDLELP